ncbi:DNA-processing protein DprA [Sinomicrobium weinanense]|uniref:DNA-protecting protein DprA n=1 Tax=Sinomicrobium weinanense TaxID=2842200 RepID=A0A926Q1Y9_9FLAO|nr:DNA-processing protein DprA [Sinomicrobium weinanense]MBC9794366.1 DNA-protecting protein DprA [Sinomicrobium weinanense]MBU3124273.1 DNA-processing protein DprA [Sinomicrobium weinanense]
MVTTSELLYVLALQNAPKIGDITAKKLIAHCGSAKAVFDERPGSLQKINGIGRLVAQSVRNRENLLAAERELKFIEDNNICCSYFEDADYPYRLKHCVDGPVLLFSMGNVDFGGKKIISVVGTRRVTSYGKRFCERLIEELSPFDPIIVSGFAYGVDITAQKAALKNGLQTVGCLAHGLNQVYPKAHKRYVNEVEANGGFVTDFWSTSSPERENFLKRNRIIAGLSEATVVIESAEKGGGLVTADIAHSYNREVFAVPGRTEDRYSSGCNNLIKSQKAHILTSAADIAYVLGWHRELEGVNRPREKSSGKQKGVQVQLFADLDETEKRIYDFLHQNGRELLDIIALECELPVYKVSSTLLNMEMKGAIRPLPGKLFEAVN